MTLAIELHVGIGEHGRVEHSVRVAIVCKPPHDVPGALDKAISARHGLGIPVEVFLGRSDEENRQAHGIGTIGLDHARRRYDVAL